ncbi:hypothetical protein [Streptomyces sp. NPDC047974]|uniref:hypothetical protein n=1 Tax=Streptomyces sp. NPDC047974 TaxID=3154343 RepID=UPI0033EC5346
MNDVHDETVIMLNETVLAPLGWPPLSHAYDLLAGRPDHLPVTQGVYVFLVAGPAIAYPVGESALAYVGKAESQRGLRGRLMTHWRNIDACMDDRNAATHARYPAHPAYEWVLARGGVCLYAESPEPGRGAWYHESRLLQAFARHHRTRPVGNGTKA